MKPSSVWPGFKGLEGKACASLACMARLSMVSGDGRRDDCRFRAEIALSTFLSAEVAAADTLKETTDSGCADGVSLR